MSFGSDRPTVPWVRSHIPLPIEIRIRVESFATISATGSVTSGNKLGATFSIPNASKVACERAERYPRNTAPLTAMFLAALLQAFPSSSPIHHTRRPKTNPKLRVPMPLGILK
jgi:hypothetical protein